MPASGQQMLHMDGGWSYDSEEEAAAAGEPWPHTCQGSSARNLGPLPGADPVLTPLLAERPVLPAEPRAAVGADVHVNFCPAGPVTEANGATEFFPRSHLVYTRQETDLRQTRAADGNAPSHPSHLSPSRPSHLSRAAEPSRTVLHAALNLADSEPGGRTLRIRVWHPKRLR